jgi:7-cyano-7-deazaguanine synthase
MRPRAVVLLSGGLDSATVLAIAREQHDVFALSFRYGQRHAVELECAKHLAKAAGVVEHVVIDVDLRQFGGSALTADIDVPKAPTEGIPVTYVPARNTIFLSYALAWAEVTKASRIYIGVNAVDYSGYPDCRPEYVAAFQHMADLATKEGVEGRGVTIAAPLLGLSKEEIIRGGSRLGVDFSLTNSCYDPAPSGACGACDSCRIRRKGFEVAGLPDPTRYAA